MPNPGLPLKIFEKPHTNLPKETRFEPKIPGRHKTT